LQNTSVFGWCFALQVGHFNTAEAVDLDDGIVGNKLGVGVLTITSTSIIIL
jgi:hypothetical protein